MLKLKPSARDSKRYLLIEGSMKDTEKAIYDYIGILGYAKANPYFVKTNVGKNRFVISVNRKEIDNIKASFAVSANKINVLRISGTLKGLMKK